jgi:hypothetical protein
MNTHLATPKVGYEHTEQPHFSLPALLTNFGGEHVAISGGKADEAS